ncbi:hypothetical protein GW17_00052265 [Ensete ventricosum]|nr:hypothetical protein GW17_00052265 [Ensete ventricosum]
MAFGGSKADTSLFEGDLQCLLRIPTLSGSSIESDVVDLCLRKRRWGVLVEPVESLLMELLPVEVELAPGPGFLVGVRASHGPPVSSMGPPIEREGLRVASLSPSLGPPQVASPREEVAWEPPALWGNGATEGL